MNLQINQKITNQYLEKNREEKLNKCKFQYYIIAC